MRAAERRVHVAAGYLRGETQQTLADALGVSQPTISNDIRKIHDRWVESTMVDFNAAKSRELQKIDHLERTYWDAWNRSLEQSTKTRVETGGASGNKSTVQREEMYGDPRFLRGVEFCIHTRCRVLGIYAAAEKEHGPNADGVLLRVVYGDDGTDDDRDE